MSVLYNENNPYCAQALRNLIAGGIIPAGDVAECSIADLTPDDVRGYNNVHFFAGIGGWAYASILARWPADRQLWSGSPPCQPFSRAGRKRGTADPRHLWPLFHRLIRACRPAVVMGEQVSGPDGEIWIAGVCADLEKDSFAIRAVDVPACAIGAPHERQRIYWVAHPNRERQFQSQGSISDKSGWSSDCDATGSLEYSQSIRRIEGRSERSGRQRQSASASSTISSSLGDTLRQRWPVSAPQPGSMGQTPGEWSEHSVERPDDASFWQDTQDIYCDWDQKWRRTKSAISNVVDGFSQYLCSSPTPDSVQIQKEIDDATAKIGGPRKVLRAMWLSTFPPSPTACPKRVSMHRLGKHEDISFAEILLPYLSNVLWRYYGEWSLFTLKEEERRILRIMRSCCEFGSAPCERKCMELGRTEYSNSLRKLSQILASHAASAWSAYRSKNAANMGFLTNGFPLRSHAFSAAGNAIVPQIAAEVMRAWLEEFPI